jgi:hypothetical protein
MSVRPVVVLASGDEDIAVGQHSGTRLASPRSHLADHSELAGDRIIQLGRVCGAVADPSAGNQDLPDRSRTAIGPTLATLISPAG